MIAPYSDRRAERRIAARAAFRGIASFLAAIFLSGCQDIFNALLDNPAPTGVSASDGDYADKIEIGWGAPSLSSEKWKDYEVDGYRVSWTGPESGSASTSGTSYSISVSPSNRAMTYSVKVESYLRRTTGGSIVSGGEASDTGFALETEDLIWYDGGGSYTIAGYDRWYVTMLQKGFTYDFAFVSGQGIVEFYKFKTLESLHSIAGFESSQSWKCDELGAGNKFYIRVQPSSPGASFRASYRF